MSPDEFWFLERTNKRKTAYLSQFFAAVMFFTEAHSFNVASNMQYVCMERSQSEYSPKRMRMIRSK